MRRLILIVIAATGLAACGKNGAQETNQVAAENLTAESIVSNDVTAIDAVTGDAANMAADVDMNYGNLETNGATPVSSQPSNPLTPRTKPPSKPPLETPTPAEPTTNNAM